MQPLFSRVLLCLCVILSWSRVGRCQGRQGATSSFSLSLGTFNSVDSFILKNVSNGIFFNSLQFSSFAQSCVTLSDVQSLKEQHPYHGKCEK